MKLTTAERHLIAQIVNIKLNTATLREHIRLEAIYQAADPENAPLPIPIDFVEESQKELFSKYENQRVADIKNKDDQKIIRDAITKSNAARDVIFQNDEKPEFEAKFSEDDVQVLKQFYDTDSRSFPRQYHKAILSLNSKLHEDPKAKEAKEAKEAKKPKKKK